MAAEGGFPSASDGSVEVDSNTGSQEDLQRELASEVAVTEADGRRSSTPAEPPAGEAGDGEELEEGGDQAVKPTGKPAGEIKPEAGKPGAVKKRSLQARIDEITRERYTTARERDAAFAERDALRTELEALKAGKPAAKAGENGKPATEPEKRAAAWSGEKVGGVQLGAEKFPKYSAWLDAGNDGDLEDWVEARESWGKTKDARVAADDRQLQEHSQRFTKTAETFTERMAPVLEAEPDFYERIDPRLIETPAASALPPGVKPTFGNFLVEQVVVSAHPKALLEHLSDKKVIQRLVTLQPDEIIRELTRFELSLGDPAATRTGPAGRATDDGDDDDDGEGDDSDGDTAAAATATSRAHPPAKPVRGSSHEHSSPDDEPGDDASDDEWFRWEQRRATKAGRG